MTTLLDDLRVLRDWYVANEVPPWVIDKIDALIEKHANSIPPLDPTPAMIEAGAQRLVRWEDGCEWPDSWDALQVSAARTEAERVWRSMWCEAMEMRERRNKNVRPPQEMDLG